MYTVKTGQEVNNQIYWDNFYKIFRIERESSFCNYIKSIVNKELFVVDLGCGIGQDTWSFYKDGYTVIGVDRSSVAIDRNNKLKSYLGASDFIEFKNLDISSEKNFSHFISDIVYKARMYNKRVIVYARFLLHSIQEDAENVLLENLSKYLEKDDLFVVEFRTIEDKNRVKVFTDHFRRYIDADQLVGKLECKYSFKTIEYSKGTGFSLYKDEDPFLARVLVKKYE